MGKIYKYISFNSVPKYLRKMVTMNVKYRISKEDEAHYYIKNKSIDKKLEGSLYIVGNIIKPMG